MFIFLLFTLLCSEYHIVLIIKYHIEAFIK
uniref:Uncharacterized protein n=1 Tax=Heterorhabditis bacteriophora TaxID=37862 RepID=A0A1I7WTI9_HETBA